MGHGASLAEVAKHAGFENSFSSSNTAHGSILFSRKQLALVVRGHIHLLVGHVFQEHKIE
jgi:hypothetical protein